ncbi:hypothetical protein K2173_008499 [Erythroxylum novogranatense]|uniref:Signal peptidase complex catalytic subunit SEC11 n=1 Tax=Erythroxylum novogranatense TaxID=1862640 RepID=A0AAV8SL84_9ROSI|nr:hypothetical protein K2173_008499 [Erythroxylum novogranatense]
MTLILYFVYNFLSVLSSLFTLRMIVTSALIIWKALMCITGTESPVVVVLSGSMEPGFKREIICFTHEQRKDPIRTGEIVVFNVDACIPSSIATHLSMSALSSQADGIVPLSVVYLMLFINFTYIQFSTSAVDEYHTFIITFHLHIIFFSLLFFYPSYWIIHFSFSLFFFYLGVYFYANWYLSTNIVTDNHLKTKFFLMIITT